MPAASVKLVPVPGVKLPPLLTLYCQVAPASRPLTFTVPTPVTPSLLLAPVSEAKTGIGAATAPPTTVMAAGLLLDVPVLPAASTCLTSTAPGA